MIPPNFRCLNYSGNSKKCLGLPAVGESASCLGGGFYT